MTIQELCIWLGAPIMIRIQYPRNEFEVCGGTHTCYLDPKRCSLVVDGKQSRPEQPFGRGFNEKDAIADLVRSLLNCRRVVALALGSRSNAAIRCRSLYDNQVREIPIPADLTA